MNWAGDLAQTHIEPNDHVLDLGCGIMHATLDFIPTYPKTRIQCGNLVGVDIYEPYLKFLEDRSIKTVKWDLTNVPYPFEDKSFDVILLYDILEHIPTLEEVESILRESERIARKKILILTPNKFKKNEESVENVYEMGRNPLQRHQLLIKRSFLRKNGYNVHLCFKGVVYNFAFKNLTSRIAQTPIPTLKEESHN